MRVSIVGELPATINAAVRGGWRRKRSRSPIGSPTITRDRPAAMRIAPRTLFCATGFRTSRRQRTFASGFRRAARSLPSPRMISGPRPSRCPGPSWRRTSTRSRREASALAAEQVQLLESIGDPTLDAGTAHRRNIGQATVTRGDARRCCGMAQNAIELRGRRCHQGRQDRDEFSPALAVSFRCLARCSGLPAGVMT
mgnify:CR=1 FL=1